MFTLRICAWCNRFMGLAAPSDDPRGEPVSHGCCADCEAELMGEAA